MIYCDRRSWSEWFRAKYIVNIIVKNINGTEVASYSFPCGKLIIFAYFKLLLEEYKIKNRNPDCTIISWIDWKS